MESALSEISPKYLTKQQAQTYTGLSARTLDYARGLGELDSYKVGKRVLFARISLDAYIERHRIGADLDQIVDEATSESGKDTRNGEAAQCN